MRLGERIGFGRFWFYLWDSCCPADLYRSDDPEEAEDYCRKMQDPEEPCRVVPFEPGPRLERGYCPVPLHILTDEEAAMDKRSK